MPLDSFRVIFLHGDPELPQQWRERLDEWQRQGGVLLQTADFALDYRGDRIETPGFTHYQAGVLAALRDHGVRPPIQVVDDNGLPEPSVEPVLLQTRDGSQFYVLAAVDWSIEGSQAFGDLGTHAFGENVELTGNFARGVPFSVTAGTTHYQVWAETRIEEPFAVQATVDGTRGVPLVLAREARSELRADRGAGGTRWVAGPAFMLDAGEHVLRVDVPAPSVVRRARIVDEALVRPRLVCRQPGVKEVYDVFNDRLLARDGDGWQLPLRASYGEIYSLITEELGLVEVEPRLLVTQADRRVQAMLRIRRADGTLSECRHAFNIRVRDGEGREIEGLRHKASIKGWGVETLYAAAEDPPLPWTVEVKDLTSGRTGTARLSHPSPEPFEALAPRPDLVLRAEPLPALEADVHIVPFRVKITNNGRRAVQGRVRVELPAELLLEGTQHVDARVAAGTTTTVEWVAVLGRRQAVHYRDEPPRVWTRHRGGGNAAGTVRRCLCPRMGEDAAVGHQYQGGPDYCDRAERPVAPAEGKIGVGASGQLGHPGTAAA